MHSTSIIALAAVTAVVVGTAYLLWQKYRRVKRQRDDWAALAKLGQETNYRLACAMHGKAAVDLAIRKANVKGHN